MKHYWMIAALIFMGGVFAGTLGMSLLDSGGSLSSANEKLYAALMRWNTALVDEEVALRDNEQADRKAVSACDSLVKSAPGVLASGWQNPKGFPYSSDGPLKGQPYLWNGDQWLFVTYSPSSQLFDTCKHKECKCR